MELRRGRPFLCPPALSRPPNDRFRRGGFETRPYNVSQQTNLACRGGFETRPYEICTYAFCGSSSMWRRIRTTSFSPRMTWSTLLLHAYFFVWSKCFKSGGGCPLRIGMMVSSPLRK